MSFVKKHKREIIAAVCVIAILAIAFFCGDGNTADTQDKATAVALQVKNDVKPEFAVKQEKKVVPEEEPQDLSAAEPSEKESEKPEDSKPDTDEKEEKQEADPEAKTEVKPAEPETKTSEVPKEPETKTAEEKIVADNTEKPQEEPEILFEEPQETEAVAESTVPVEAPVSEKNSDVGELTCVMSVCCDNAVGKLSEKSGVIPDDGIIFPEQTVVFYEGESVFNLLVRELKKNKIHLEFVNVPVYNSAYIEGISNLYEFDCGELSGWMYSVNGWFPNYGCSGYQLKAGDRIEWVYTCDLGADVGGSYSARNGR